MIGAGSICLSFPCTFFQLTRPNIGMLPKHYSASPSLNIILINSYSQEQAILTINSKVPGMNNRSKMCIHFLLFYSAFTPSHAAPLAPSFTSIKCVAGDHTTQIQRELIINLLRCAGIHQQIEIK